MTTEAAHVNSVLSAAGRNVELQQTERELDELEGLEPEAAETVLLSSYGLDPAGHPNPWLLPDSPHPPPRPRTAPLQRNHSQRIACACSGAPGMR